jgi:protocatechuate 3,4-dioxygenase beta subunit
MGVYSIGDLDRRDLMKMTAALAASVTALSTRRAAAEDLARTPQQILGPFYPLKEFPQTTDLTQIPGRPGRAQGQIINVMGRVLNISGDPVRNAMVEVWQANANGRYTHPSDPNPAPLDPNFDGFAVVTTDAEGRYRFKTIKPAAYPAGPNLIRPAHIHFQVSGRQDRVALTVRRQR